VGNARAWGIVEPIIQPIPQGLGLAHIHDSEIVGAQLSNCQPINRKLVVPLDCDCLGIEAVGRILKDCFVPPSSDLTQDFNFNSELCLL
jgi:hypothetical protein